MYLCLCFYVMSEQSYLYRLYMGTFSRLACLHCPPSISLSEFCSTRVYNDLLCTVYSSAKHSVKHSFRLAPVEFFSSTQEPARATDQSNGGGLRATSFLLQPLTIGSGDQPLRISNDHFLCSTERIEHL